MALNIIQKTKSEIRHRRGQKKYQHPRVRKEYTSVCARSATAYCRRSRTVAVALTLKDRYWGLSCVLTRAEIDRHKQHAEIRL